MEDNKIFDWRDNLFEMNEVKPILWQKDNGYKNDLFWHSAHIYVVGYVIERFPTVEIQRRNFSIILQEKLGRNFIFCSKWYENQTE